MTKEQNIVRGLDRISKWAKMHPEQDSYSISGITPSDIEKVLKGFPFEIPRELYLLYEHGYTGIELGSSPFEFLNIQNSVDHCIKFWISARIPCTTFKVLGRNYLHLYESCFEDKNFMKILDQYPIDWCEFPISYGFGKENYIIRCYKTKADYSPVWVRFIGVSPVMYASSLTNLILTMAECYETDAYYSTFIKEDNFYDIQQNLTKVESIFEKYNPDQIDTWRSIWKD